MAFITRSRSSPRSFRSVPAAWLASSTRHTALWLLCEQLFLQFCPRDRPPLLVFLSAALPEPDKLRRPSKDHVLDVLSECNHHRSPSSPLGADECSAFL